MASVIPEKRGKGRTCIFKGAIPTDVLYARLHGNVASHFKAVNDGSCGRCLHGSPLIQKAVLGKLRPAIIAGDNNRA